MLGFLKKKKQPEGSKAVFKIKGMHCTSCSMSIDGELEDTEGVVEATTSYKKAITTVFYDEKKVSVNDVQKVIEGLDYEVELS